MGRTIKICMAGFGNVAISFLSLLLQKESELMSDYQCKFILTAVSTLHKGTLINTDGLDIRSVIKTVKETNGFDRDSRCFSECGVCEMIDGSGADLFIELTSLSIEDGEPASSYIRHALNAGMHVITANKGPVAWYYDELDRLARRMGKMFLYETTVMDGTPVFNLAEKTLHGNKILGIRGILNGTTNFILSELEAGRTYDEAIKNAQELQITETDPSMDVDGWDGAAKICALANVLMGARITPRDVKVESIRSVTRQDILSGGVSGKRLKYICEAKYTDGNLELRVEPQLLPLSDPLAHVSGTSAAVGIYTDLAGEITVVQSNPGILQTAYGVYSDLIAICKTLKEK